MCRRTVGKEDEEDTAEDELVEDNITILVTK